MCVHERPCVDSLECTAAMEHLRWRQRDEALAVPGQGVRRVEPVHRRRLRTIARRSAQQRLRALRRHHAHVKRGVKALFLKRGRDKVGPERLGRQVGGGGVGEGTQLWGGQCGAPALAQAAPPQRVLRCTQVEHSLATKASAWAVACGLTRLLMTRDTTRGGSAAVSRAQSGGPCRACARWAGVSPNGSNASTCCGWAEREWGGGGALIWCSLVDVMGLGQAGGGAQR